MWPLFFHKRYVLSVIIFRYITKEIITTLFVSTVILMLLFTTNQSVQFLQRAANGEIPATELVQLISLQLPLLLGYLLPLGLYLGILLALGRLYADSEMTVLFACGFSRVKLTMIVLVTALMISSITAWLMIDLVPKAQGDINYIINKAEVTASVSKVIPGRFMAIGKPEDHAVFYAKRVDDHFLMHDVFMAMPLKNANHSLSHQWNIVTAQTAFEQTSLHNNDNYLILNHGYRYVGVPGERKFQEVQFDQYGMKITPTAIPDHNKVQYEPISQLWASFFSDPEAAAELHWR